MKNTVKKLILIGLSILAFASCSKKSDDLVNGEKTFTVRLVTDATGIDDKSFNAAAWRGILNFYGDTEKNQSKRGELYDVITCTSQDMFVPSLKQIADEEYDLIVTTGFRFADAINEVSPLYPKQRFMIIDVDWLAQKNLQQFVFAEEEGAFLAGATAALQSKKEGIENPKFGFVGGVPNSVITRLELGFYQGVYAIIEDATIYDYYANSWDNPSLGKMQAKNWFDQGVYAIFSAAGATGNGVIAQAKELRIQGKNVWAIGVDSDQYKDGLYAGDKSAVLTSMVKKIETATYTSLKDLSTETWIGGKTIRLGLSEKGIDITYTNKELDVSVIKEIEKLKEDIIAKKIALYKTYKEALAAGVVPQGLGALD